MFVTHDQEEALEVADRIVVMNQGVIEQIGTPGDVYEHPQSAFVYEFLGAANRLRRRGARRWFRGRRRERRRSRWPPISPAARTPMCARTTCRWWRMPTRRHRDGIAVDVRRVVPLGGSVRVELEPRAGGALLEAELDREAWRALALVVGDGATAVARSARVFPAR